MLALATIALYWPATGHDFVNYDDDVYVLNNVHVTSGVTLESGLWALRSRYAANWHPITWLSHMLDCQVFGLKPWGHHFINVVLHALNSVLVFIWLRQMTGTLWRSLFVAALFAVHPLRVETVAWVSERKDVLSAFFGVLALMAYARYAEGIRRKPEARVTSSLLGTAWTFSYRTSSVCYWLSLCCLGLGLMSKPMLVTWPLVMLLLDYWPLRRFGASTDESQVSNALRLVREKVPFFALTAAASVVTFVVQKQGGAMRDTLSLPLGARIGNALVSYGRYLGKLFWPMDLAVYYPHPGYWPLGWVLLMTGVILSLTALAWVRRQGSPYLLVGWLWYLVTLVPVIGLVQVGEQAVADRYSYLPSLGVLIFVVWGAGELAQGRRYELPALCVAAIAAIAACSCLTREQLGHWKNTESLFRHTIAVTRNNSMAHDNLGVALLKQGRVDEAMSEFHRALRLRPTDARAHYNLGIALFRKGQIVEATHQYREALRLKPGYAEVYFNLGNALEDQRQTGAAPARPPADSSP